MQRLPERGWAIIRGAATPRSVAALRQAFDALLDPASGPAGVLQRPAPRLHSPAVAAWTCSAALGAIAREALDAAEVQLLQDALVLKPPGRQGSEIAWHRDYTHLAFLDAPRALSVRLALDDETLASGALRVLEGSHRHAASGARPLLGDTLHPEEDAALAREAARGTVRTLELAPGDVSIHLCLTAHGSHANSSAAPRRTLVTHLFDAACRLVPERLPTPDAAAWFPTDARGHLCRHTFPLLPVQERMADG